MSRRFKTFRVLMMAGLIAGFGMYGCTKKPSQDEITKLEQARGAAESAEKKLSELRTERQQLEAELDRKKQELQKNESERDEMKAKMGSGK